MFLLGSLLLVKVGPHSAGNYSCSSHKSNSATVSINVVDGGRHLIYNHHISPPPTPGELTPEAMLEEDMKLLSSGQSSPLTVPAIARYLLSSLFSLLSLYFYKQL